MNPFLHLAAAAGGAAANAAINRATQWLSGPAQPQPLNTMGQLAVALPPTRRGGGLRRRGAARGGNTNRGRGRRQPRRSRTGQPMGISTAGGEKLTVQGTEVVGTLDGTLQKFQFNPAVDTMVRLKNYEKMYTRYRIIYFNISFKSGSSTNTAGNVTMGLHPGPSNANIKDATTILQLRPSQYLPIWQSTTMNVGGSIDSQRFMYCGKDTDDGIAFTLYVIGLKGGGIIQASYKIEFAYPNPF